MASGLPAAADCPATRWSLDDLARRLVNEYADQAMSRATIGRTLDAADLKPHRSVDWLNSHDPDFERRAKEICARYVQSPALYERGQLVICTDEKTGMQILQRKQPTQPARPGQPEKREQDYVRHGTRARIASFVVATGEVAWDLGPTRTAQDCAAHLLHCARHVGRRPGITWVLDNLNTHWSPDACEVLAMLNELLFCPRSLRTGAQRRAFLTDPGHAYRFVFTPKHGSWLNQVELFFSVLARRFLRRGDFGEAEEFAARLWAFLEDYNRRHAHPYRWSYTGQPCGGRRSARPRRQQRRGRAWFGGRPQRFDRSLDPPRPYKRRVA